MKKGLVLSSFILCFVHSFSQDTWVQRDSINGAPKSVGAIFTLSDDAYFLTGLDVFDFKRSMYKYDITQDDWDDAGGEKYEDQTWINAMSFLARYAQHLFNDFNIIINSPKIYHGPKGSIDILWEPSAYRLVINIPKDGNKAMFYADDYKDQITEGVFHLDNFNISLIPFAIQL